MVINFRACKISQGTHKLARTPTYIYIYINLDNQAKKDCAREQRNYLSTNLYACMPCSDGEIPDTN